MAMNPIGTLGGWRSLRLGEGSGCAAGAETIRHPRSAVGALELSPARKGWETIRRPPERRRRDTQTCNYADDGNVTNDFIHTYSWNSDGRPVTIGSSTLTFDALGRKVEEASSSGTSQFLYTPTGALLAVMIGQSLDVGFLPLTNGLTAEYWSNGTVY